MTAIIRTTTGRRMYLLVALVAIFPPSSLAIDITALVSNVNATNIENHIRALAATPRYSDQELANTETYLTNELESYGYTVAREEMQIGVGEDQRSSANIVAEIAGTTNPDEIFIIGAHFDTVRTSFGADDNASSVAGMLEIARVLANQSLPKTIRFIGFTFEEVGYLGSKLHAETAKANGENIIGMFSLEMIGYTCTTPNCQVEFKDDPTCPLPSEFPYQQCVFSPSECIQITPPGITTGERIAITVNLPSTQILHILLGAREQFVSDLEIFAGEVLGDGGCFPDTQRSDHASFWAEAFPALMLNDTGPFRNTNYHLPADVPDTIDFPFATKVTKLALATVLRFIEPDDRFKFEGVTAPTFIDRGFGPDGEWLTADDYVVAGMNPTGAVSGFRLRDPETLGADAFVGTFEDFSFFLKAPLQLGVNEVVRDTAKVFGTTFSDESTQTPATSPLLHSFRGVLENPPMKTQTLTLHPNNTFERLKRYRYRESFPEYPVLQTLGGYFLMRGQNAADIFDGQTSIINLFNSITPSLPNDWQIVFFDTFVTQEPAISEFHYS
ncbi:MAG: M28 family peptidase, partial [Pseudomonadota bacterium]